MSLLADCFWHAEAAQDMPTPTTHRHAKPEARSHRTPQTARPAKGGASHEDRYEGPSNPYVDVEWEDSPPVGTKVWPCSVGVFLVVDPA